MAVLRRGKRLSWNALEQAFAQAKDGDCMAQEDLFSFLRARLLSIATKRLEEEAEDVVQEALITVNDHVSRFGTLRELLGFAHGVLRNKIGNVYKRRARERALRVEWSEIEEPHYEIHSEVETAELDRIICESINNVSQRHPSYEALLWGLYEGMDVAELSGRLGISKAKLKWRTFRCRQALREVLLNLRGLQV
jgi:RNA polymerase sigma factor (sigma-70 family)